MPLIPLNWLADHVELPAGYTAQQLAADLVKVGLEEERIVPAAVTGPLVVGKVLSLVKEPQKNGKTINYCRVDVGEHNDAPGTGAEPADVASRSIVCGAHNFEVGDLVAVVLPGAVLPGPFPISARKTYGHISDGMICSERELGLGDSHDGILVLTEKFEPAQIPAPGESLLPLLGLDREVLEINITPDRGYCFSMRGVGRELHHSTGFKFTDRALISGTEAGAPGFRVEVDDAAPIRGNIGCDRFVTRIVRGVNPQAQTPAWMVQYLEAAGQRSISLAVDITNYVMLDLGQPLHAYDLGTVHEPIVVRRAHAGEELTTLDDQVRQLAGEDLLITDSPAGERGSRVIGLAGVMGGASTEISATTTDVLIEAAHFDPVTIARTARRHKLPSEASKRFERGVDPALPGAASLLAARLLAEYGGGEIAPEVFDLDTCAAPAPLTMAWDYPARLTGVAYSRERVIELLRAIGCDVAEAGDDLQVTPPSWRPDLVGPAHLVEEVARLDGYDNIPAQLPIPTVQAQTDPGFKVRRQLHAAAVAQNLTEVMSYPFIGDTHDRQLLAADDERRDAVRLRNPLAQDMPALRTRLLDTLLETAGRNIKRGLSAVAIFEAGLVASGRASQSVGLPAATARPDADTVKGLFKAVPTQNEHLALVLAGKRGGAPVRGGDQEWGWADAIAAMLGIASALGVTLEVEAAQYLPYHPGRCAALKLGNQVVGHAGQLHPGVCENFDLPTSACAGEINLEPIVKRAVKAGPLAVRPVSTFPVVKEDIAVVVAEAEPAAALKRTILNALGEYGEGVELFDEYRGDNLQPGTKSLAFNLRIRAADRTLGAEEITQLRNKVIKQLARKHSAQLRA